MDKNQIENLIKLMKQYEIDHVKIENQDKEIEIKIDRNDSTFKQENTQIKEKTIPEDDSNYITIKSDYVGVFIESEKEIVPDSNIKKGQTLGYIEMGNIKKAIVSDYDGIIEEIYVEHNEIVEFGQDLFKIKLHK